MVYLQIGSVSFPLEVSAVTQPTEQTVDTISALIELGTYFYSPSSFQAVKIQLASFKDWLSTNGYSIPENLTNVIADTSIEINHISISSSGAFDFSFAADFDPPLGSGLTNGFIEIKNIGLSIARSSK